MSTPLPGCRDCSPPTTPRSSPLTCPVVESDSPYLCPEEEGDESGMLGMPSISMHPRAAINLSHCAEFNQFLPIPTTIPEHMDPLFSSGNIAIPTTIPTTIPCAQLASSRSVKWGLKRFGSAASRFDAFQHTTPSIPSSSTLHTAPSTPRLAINHDAAGRLNMQRRGDRAAAGAVLQGPTHSSAGGQPARSVAPARRRPGPNNNHRVERQNRRDSKMEQLKQQLKESTVEQVNHKGSRMQQLRQLKEVWRNELNLTNGTEELSVVGAATIAPSMPRISIKPRCGHDSVKHSVSLATLPKEMLCLIGSLLPLDGTSRANFMCTGVELSSAAADAEVLRARASWVAATHNRRLCGDQPLSLTERVAVDAIMRDAVIAVSHLKGTHYPLDLVITMLNSAQILCSLTRCLLIDCRHSPKWPSRLRQRDETKKDSESETARVRQRV